MIVMVKIQVTHKCIKLVMNTIGLLAVGEEMGWSLFEVMS
jgi:hypothetical protein